MHYADLTLQVLLAAALGAAVGLERELSAQPAGLRTHVLVSLGSALFTLAGAQFAHTDPTRVAAQVVTGIGFLTGGAILRDAFTVRGLTTAASLWVTAAAGLAVGLREYVAATAVVALALLVLSGLKFVERDFFPRRRGVEVTLELDGSRPMHDVRQAVGDLLGGMAVTAIEQTGGVQRLVVRGRPPTATITEIADTLRALPSVAGVAIRQ